MNTTYTLTFDQDSLKALNLLVFTLNHLKVLDMDMEGIEDGLSAVIETDSEKADKLSAAFYNAVYEQEEKAA